MSTQLSPLPSAELAELREELVQLREQITADAGRRLEAYRARYAGGYSADACNLASYLAMRSHELRPLQERLVAAGVSSLGRGESQVQTNLNRVIGVLSQALGLDAPVGLPEDGARCLERNAEQLFGRRSHSRYARIMVTLPGEAAGRPELLADLVASGMDCVRINCAHDGPAVWQGMIDNLRAAKENGGTGTKVFMDLGGHKIRTGPMQSEPAVLHLKVRRNALGQRTGATRVVLCSHAARPGDGDTPDLQRLPLPAQLLDHLQAGDRLAFRDSRAKRRRLRVREPLAGGEWLAEISRAAYVRPGMPLYLEASAARRAGLASDAPFRVGDFDGKPTAMRVFRGEQLLLTRNGRPGRPARIAAGTPRPAQISCSHPEIIGQLRPGHAVWIDDGKLGCVVEQVAKQGVLLQVTHAGPKGVRIRADKGINLPDTPLPLPALTDKDLEDLDFVCAHADMVGLSFVRQLEDIDELRRQLAVRGRPDLPIVLKVETAAAVKNLPDLLLGTMGLHPMGVMIARGDLAVELGSVRMAEIQEEILWICEAARVPVIWATQVLETLAKDGLIDRPEITDAAMSVRAECVMMNKGPFITDAVVILNDILTRMDAHQYKKVSRLRRLHW
jgi:pyruvate kinase